MAKAKGIFKRGQVYWIRYAGPTGRIIRESTGGGSFRAAQDILVARKKAVQDGLEPAPKRIGRHSFRELAEKYLEWAQRQKNIRAKTYIMKFLVQNFGNCPLSRFNTLMVENYQTQCLNAGKAPATVNRRLATLKHAFTKAVQWEMASEETLKRVRAVKLLPEENGRLRYLSLQEEIALLENCPDHLKPIVVCGLNTGMRKEEILGLKWRQVDMKGGFIHLEKTKNGKRRSIPVNETLKETLRSLPRRLGGTYVFTKEDGGRFQNVRRSFETAKRKAGIVDFRFHDLRHTFASNLVMKGASLTVVKELMGHKTLAMTLRYAHLSPDHRKSAVSLLDQSTAQLLHNRANEGKVANA